MDEWTNAEWYVAWWLNVCKKDIDTEYVDEMIDGMKNEFKHYSDQWTITYNSLSIIKDFH